MFIVLDNGEKLTSWPTINEAVEYVKECKLEDIAENDEGFHQYIIKEQQSKADKVKQAVKEKEAGPARRSVLFAWSIFTGVIGWSWWIVWFSIKASASILAWFILTSLELLLFSIKAVIFLIVLVISIKANCTD